MRGSLVLAASLVGVAAFFIRLYAQHAPQHRILGRGTNPTGTHRMGCKLSDNFIFWAFAIWSQMQYSFLRYMCESSATPWADHLFHKTALNEASDIVDQTIKKNTTKDSSQTMMVTIMLKMRTVTLMLLVVRVVMAIFNHVLCICNRAQEASGPFFCWLPAQVTGAFFNFYVFLDFSETFLRIFFCILDVSIFNFSKNVLKTPSSAPVTRPGHSFSSHFGDVSSCSS